jgi:hypothetical protein
MSSSSYDTGIWKDLFNAIASEDAESQESNICRIFQVLLDGKGNNKYNVETTAKWRLADFLRLTTGEKPDSLVVEVKKEIKSRLSKPAEGVDKKNNRTIKFTIPSVSLDQAIYDKLILNKIEDEENKAVHVYSIDSDDCINPTNRELINKVRNGEESSKLPISHYLEENNLFDTNQHGQLIKHINSTVGKKILYSGSNRQSISDELGNTVLKKNKLSFFILSDLAKKLNMDFNKLLMADINYNRSPGKSYKIGLEKIAEIHKKENVKVLTDENPLALAGRDKVFLLYAQMHDVAIKHPNIPIVFEFFDDKKEEIIDILGKFYSENPYLIPKNITLQLHHYVTRQERTVNTSKVSTSNNANSGSSQYKTVSTFSKDLHSIQGKGLADTEFRMTIQAIIDALVEKQGVDKSKDKISASWLNSEQFDDDLLQQITLYRLANQLNGYKGKGSLACSFFPAKHKGKASTILSLVNSFLENKGIDENAIRSTVMSIVVDDSLSSSKRLKGILENYLEECNYLDERSNNNNVASTSFYTV